MREPVPPSQTRRLTLATVPRPIMGVGLPSLRPPRQHPVLLDGEHSAQQTGDIRTSSSEFRGWRP